MNPELELHLDAIKYKRRCRVKPLVRIYMGSFYNNQWRRFSVFLGSFEAKYNLEVEVLNIQDVHERRMTEVEFVEYLLAADIHFIFGHVHQGEKIRALQWNMETLKDNLYRLKYHNGFPTGVEVQCPVFLQDKMAYLIALDDFANPTLRIDLVENGSYQALSITIQE